MGDSTDSGQEEPPGEAMKPQEEGMEGQCQHEPGRSCAEQQKISPLSPDSIVAETPPSCDDEEATEDTAETTACQDGDMSEAKITAGLPATSGTTAGAAPPEGKCSINASSPKDREEQEDHQEPLPVKPQEMYEAVVHEMKSAPDEPPRAAWKLTIEELYTVVHDSVKIRAELVPANKKRYPKLNSNERAVLFQLFEEVSIAGGRSYDEWFRIATLVTQKLYNTKWSFINLVHEKISTLKWERLPQVNPWEEQAGDAVASGSSEDSMQQQYQRFLFQPGYFSKQEVESLTALCEKPALLSTTRRLRKGSKDEWKIITGIAEGRIVCRQMPAFLKEILSADDRLRLYSTVQVQVEGELVFQLKAPTSVSTSRQSTRALKDEILFAGQTSKVNMVEVYQMLALAKTISYDAPRRTIHFYFFDRAMATRFQTTRVPFKGLVYQLLNKHPTAVHGTVWERQKERERGTLPRPHEYTVYLRNVNRFLDIGRLSAYFQQHIAAETELEDMDMGYRATYLVWTNNYYSASGSRKSDPMLAMRKSWAYHDTVPLLR